MITYIKGDIFTTNADIIAQGINCEGIVNGGLAKKIREMYPQMHNEYISACRAGLAIPGEIMFYYSHNDKPHIMNLFIQDRKRDGGPKIEYIEKALDNLINSYSKLKIKWKNGKIAMPRIGASSKVIKWEEEIRPIIEKKFSRIDIPLEVYLEVYIVRASHTLK